MQQYATKLRFYKHVHKNRAFAVRQYDIHINSTPLKHISIIDILVTVHYNLTAIKY